VKDSSVFVVGIDSLNDYYSVDLKKDRLDALGIDKSLIDSHLTLIESLKYHNFIFRKVNIAESKNLENLFEEHNFDQVINLAAQAGVRYSVLYPHSYVENNITGFLNILEACHKYQVKHLIYASSSSVYGLNSVPFSETHGVDHPISMYAVSKRTNELMSHTYSNMYNLPVTGLRFFTVYGPYGRPDMAPILFANAIRDGKAIQLFNHGYLKRDFTYVADIAESIYRLLSFPPVKSEREKESMGNGRMLPNISTAPFRILNIGNDKPVDISLFISLLENAMGKKAILNKVPMQDGDVVETWANIDNLSELIGYRPNTTIEDGVLKFVQWYKDYYCV
jgi:UDP-glucuronate 4-epimerase